MVNVIVSEGSNQPEWLLTAIFGPPAKADRLDACNFIREIREEVDLPWVLLGDLNTIFNHSEKSGGNDFYLSDVRDILNIIDSTGLVNLGLPWAYIYLE
ncbi:hypothetical protein BVC80_8441g11 [Macleaya cordata]|uniref:Endonuclease/exonuclease/phosphatase n=1 Tax=Macleaya cordata TaxID=56857 RepID=A0A200Q339_MACCD|nr:hypothetical protein BVC80_8441g11 [Macleaya cordata]